MHDLKTLHGGYAVHAYAQELADGRFSPVAVVNADEGGESVDSVIKVPPPHEFVDGKAASTHALGAAIAWIDAHG